MYINAAIKRDVPFNPNIKDGRCTEGITPAKSNWARPIDRPPYLCWPLHGAIAYTFGGVATNPEAEVLADADQLGRERNVPQDTGQPERREELRRAGQREHEVLEEGVGDEHDAQHRRKDIFGATMQPGAGFSEQRIHGSPGDPHASGRQRGRAVQ